MTRLNLGRSFAIALITCGPALTSINAQGGLPPDNRARASTPRGGLQRAGDQRLSDEQRRRVERRLQDRIDQIVRDSLALSDEQFGRMREVASRIEGDQRALRSEEMSIRMAIRQELFAGVRADEKRVGDLLENMLRLERRRLELQEREQKDLAKFLSATQRARYIGLQDNLRRSMQDLQRRRLDLDSGGPKVRPGLRRLPRPPGRM